MDGGVSGGHRLNSGLGKVDVLADGVAAMPSDEFPHTWGQVSQYSDRQVERGGLRCVARSRMRIAAHVQEISYSIHYEIRIHSVRSCLPISICIPELLPAVTVVFGGGQHPQRVTNGVYPPGVSSTTCRDINPVVLGAACTRSCVTMTPSATIKLAATTRISYRAHPVFPCHQRRKISACCGCTDR